MLHYIYIYIHIYTYLQYIKCMDEVAQMEFKFLNLSPQLKPFGVVYPSPVSHIIIQQDIYHIILPTLGIPWMKNSLDYIRHNNLARDKQSDRQILAWPSSQQ